VPFLDPHVVQLAAQIPVGFKIDGGEGKQILRALLYRYVPRALVDRPKAGFAVPVAAWLKGPLKSWADELLSAIPRDGLLDGAVIGARWHAHLEGREDASQALWNVLMFLAWQREHARA
jgi:asparagine synthase (glutamine-hydrolysing)